MHKHFFAFTILLFSILGVSCYFDSENDFSTNGDFVSFETDVATLLKTDCATSGCHAGSFPAAGLNLNIDDSDATLLYADVSGQITVATPEESTLLQKASAAVSHTGSSVVTWESSSDEYKLILKWITDGAFNDNCDGITHDFTTNIIPIFSQCTTAGCHDTTVPVLSTNPYQNIQDAGAVNTGSPSDSSLLRKPLGLDNHSGGQIFDDTGDADYKKIFCWIKVDDAIEN
jgi:hypothetical protein